VLSPGPFVFSIGRRRDPAAACPRLDGGPPSASPLSAAAVPCAPGCDSRPAQPDGRRAGAPGPALRRAPEDHGPRQGAGLRGGVPEDGLVRHGAGHAEGARPARRRAHLLRQRQLPAGESLGGRDGLNSEALNIIDMNTRFYGVSDYTS